MAHGPSTRHGHMRQAGSNVLPGSLTSAYKYKARNTQVAATYSCVSDVGPRGQDRAVVRAVRSPSWPWYMYNSCHREGVWGGSPRIMRRKHQRAGASALASAINANHLPLESFFLVASPSVQLSTAGRFGVMRQGSLLWSMAEGVHAKPQ